MNFMQLAVQIFGIKPIITAIIQGDVNADDCEQPVGWFDLLDPQWAITQCVLDKVKLHTMYIRNSDYRMMCFCC